MRRIGVAGVVAGLVLLSGVPAAAEPDVRQATFDVYCEPNDPGLEELSGLTSIDGVLYAIGDSGTDHRLAVLDEKCAVSRWLDVPVDPYDVEDLGSYGGQLWLSDTGDNQLRRESVALTRMDPSTGQGELHRLTYPDGAHDAEAILIEPGGRPVIVTKALSGNSGIYVPATDQSVDELSSPGPTPLKKVGERTFERTSTPGGPPIVIGSILATGGAVSDDGTVAAIRTYNDVYLFSVADGDVASALTGDPVVLGLPAQPQGEAVTFTSAGDLLIASEAAGGPLPAIEILRDATSKVQSETGATVAGTTFGSRGVVGALIAAAAALIVSIVFGVRSIRRRR